MISGKSPRSDSQSDTIHAPVYSPQGITLTCSFLSKARVRSIAAMQAPEMEEPRQEEFSDCSCSHLSPFLNLFLSRGFTSLCPGSTSCFLQIQLRQLLAHHAKFPGALEPLDSLGPNVGKSQASRQGWDCSKSTSLGNWGESQKSKLQKQRNRQLIEHRFLLPERLKYSLRKVCCKNK